MQRTEDAVNAASLDALLNTQFYASYTVVEAIARLAAVEHIQTTQVRSTGFSRLPTFLRLAAFLQTTDDVATDTYYLKREATEVEGVAFTADVDALLRRPGALDSFAALAKQPCVRDGFDAHRPRLTQAALERSLRARFMHLRLPDAIAQHAANTEANARANAAAAVDSLVDFSSPDLNNLLRCEMTWFNDTTNLNLCRTLLEERRCDAFYLFNTNVCSSMSGERSPPREIDGKVLCVPVWTKARWDLAVIVHMGRSAVDIHIFGPRRNCATKVVAKVEAFARTMLGASQIRHVHMPLTPRAVAKEFHFAYMAVTLRDLLREHAERRTSTYHNGVLDVDWMHDFAPSHSYDDIAAMHAYARALKTQAAEPVEDAEAIQELPASASSSPASVEEAEPSASKRKTSNEDPAPKTPSKKAKKQ